MASNRLLINYLPPYMQEYAEMQEIMKAEQPEFDFLWEAFETAMNNQFIEDATEYGVRRWESMLDITPKDTDTIDERKFRILTRLNQELPYTLTKMREILTTLCGADGYSINLQAEKYHVEIRIALGHHNNYMEVVKVIDKMVPANMTTYVKLMYNTYDTIGAFRHKDLVPYTHDQLRKEVFEGA